MAKTQKPSEDEKIVKENIQKRFKTMFAGQNQPLSNMSLKEVEALQARVAELEALVTGQQAAPPASKPVAAPAEPPTQPPSARAARRIDAVQQKPVGTTAQEKSIGLWMAGISGAAGLIFFILSLYIVFILQKGVWELSDQVLMPTTALMFIAGLIGMRLVRLNRLTPAVWVPYLMNAIVGPIMVVLVLKNFYVLMAGYIVLFSLVVIGLVLPKTSRLRAIIIVVGALLVCTAIEIWNPAFRLSTSQIQNFTLMVLGPAAMAILLLFFITNQTRHPGIQSRLTILLMVIMVPLLVAISLIVTSIARVGMETGANTQLQGNSKGLADGISTWLELNTDALETLALQPDLIGMNAEEQRPVLQAMAKAYPYMYLVSTTDLNGMNVARNDDAKLTDYSDRAWFQGAKSGAPITYQSLIGKTTGQPALVVSTPIKDASGKIVGAAMFAADLTDLSKEVRVSRIGKRGFTFLVDANNQTLAHPDEKVTADLQDMSNYPPVAALRQGKTGMVTFTDESGERWRAYVTPLDNGWAVITQQPESEILAQVNQFQSTVTLLILFGGMIMLVLLWFVTRRTLQPITALTSNVSAIAAGDLNRMVEVSSQDEIGKLAHAFNIMTSQIRNLIGGLEQRVADRTHDLELAAEVGRTATEKIMQQAEMLAEAVEMIRTRFDLYYTQVYLTDPSGEKLILSAGTGEAGKELLQRKHSLVINAGSLNGRAVIEQRAQIVADTRENPAFLPNPLLPKTRSEMCVPLIVSATVVGVLDMQSEEPGALSESNLPAFEALAGQLAIAIRNATLFREAQEARVEMETQVRRSAQEGWQDFLNAIQEGQKLGFAFDDSRVIRLKSEELSTALSAEGLNLPIMVTGAKIGAIQLPANLKANELELVRSVGDQLAQHAENLRLLAQAERYRAEAEQAVRRLTHEGWDSFLKIHEELGQGYLYDLIEVKPQSQESQPSSAYALKHELVIGNQVVGELTVDTPDQPKEAAEVIGAVAEQLSSHIETLRLSELNEKHAQREQTLRQITSSLRSSNDAATIMRTAVRELGSITGRRTVIQLAGPQGAGEAESTDPENKSDAPVHPS